MDAPIPHHRAWSFRAVATALTLACVTIGGRADKDVLTR
jgi:hypothetical protein